MTIKLFTGMFGREALPVTPTHTTPTDAQIEAMRDKALAIINARPKTKRLPRIGAKHEPGRLLRSRGVYQETLPTLDADALVLQHVLLGRQATPAARLASLSRRWTR